MPQLLRHSAIILQDIIHLPESETSERLQLVTSEGALPCRYHPAEGEHAILWVFGAGGGLGGPAGGLYTRLGRQFREYGTASLELDYRQAGVLEDCIPDVLIGLAYLESLGKSQIALVGHFFGGAVVINAGVISEPSSPSRRSAARRLALRLSASLAPSLSSSSMAGRMKFCRRPAHEVSTLVRASLRSLSFIPTAFTALINAERHSTGICLGGFVTCLPD
jgi:hypothetical protein